MSKEITLNNGMATIVDDDIYEYLSQWKWCALYTNGKWYAHRTVGHKPSKALFIHRIAINALDGVKVDHRNGNGLDNRRENLRLATNSQNAQNSKVRSDNKLGYKGVYNNGGRFRAQIVFKGMRVGLGQFGTPEEAARAYDRAAKKFFGEFAKTNFE